MPKSLSSPSARQELVDRLRRLTPRSSANWGRMTAPQMLAHVADWMLMASGELPVASKNLVLRHPPLKQLLIYVLPFPKGVPTAPELLARRPADWQAEQDMVCDRVQSFDKLFARNEWPEHPAFGRISPQAWGVLAYRHTDHHLRQFGV
jgi:hypothetical protein